MLQRIQTIYLLLALIASLLFLFIPLASVGDGITIFANKVLLKQMVIDSTYLPSWLYMILPIVCMFLIGFTITQFKNRTLQMKLAASASLLCSVWAVLHFIQLDKILLHKMINGIISYEIGSFMPVVAIPFLILAYRGIKKDEDLVRSVDRLR